MDIATPLGLLLGVTCMVIAFVLDGGHVSALFSFTAALIVFGGTIGAVIASHTLKEALMIPKLIKHVVKREQVDMEEIIQYLVGISEKARSHGLLSLEKEINSPEIERFDPIMKDCLELVIDGTDSDTFKQIIENKIYLSTMNDKKRAGIFEAAGGFAPTMGIIGTVMGLVHVLSNLSEPDKLGPAIAVAFLATLYGIGSANLLWLPIGHKLKSINAQNKLILELIMEGALSIQGGENPLILRRKLTTFIIEDTKKAPVNTPKEREAHESA